jgi:hypothetical protein
MAKEAVANARAAIAAVAIFLIFVMDVFLEVRRSEDRSAVIHP